MKVIETNLVGETVFDAKNVSYVVRAVIQRGDDMRLLCEHRESGVLCEHGHLDVRTKVRVKW